MGHVQNDPTQMPLALGRGIRSSDTLEQQTMVASLSQAGMIRYLR